MKVTAVTFRPSDSIAIANCLASISVGNDFVSLGRGAEEKRSFGVSTETNQWLVNLYLAIMTAMAALSTRKECNARTLSDNDQISGWNGHHQARTPCRKSAKAQSRCAPARC